MGAKILGIDPGIALTGYGIIEDTGAGRSGWITSGCIKTSSQSCHAERLRVIHQKVAELGKSYELSAISLEDVFFNKNIRTALTTGEARGVIILAGALNQIPVHHYTPLQIKSSITGDGRADKKQMQKMVSLLLGVPDNFQNDDEADALAAALCHLQQIKWEKQASRGESF